MSRILIAYATRHGATQEIAEYMARELREGGAQVDVVRARAAPPASGYDAYVVGAPIYFHLWDPEATAFVKRSARELGRKPFAAFGVGLSLVDGVQLSRETALACVRASLAREVPDVPVDALTVFEGALRPEQHGWLTRTFLRLAHAPTGDFRRWSEIRQWILGLGFHLGPPPMPPPDLEARAP